MDAARDAQTATQENYRVNAIRFQAGVGTSLELSDALLSDTQAQDQYITSLADLRIGLVALQRAAADFRAHVEARAPYITAHLSVRRVEADYERLSPQDCRSFLGVRFLEHALARQVDAPLVVDLGDAHDDFVADLHLVLDAVHAMGASCEMCTSPSLPGRICTNAPKFMIRFTMPV